MRFAIALAMVALTFATPASAQQVDIRATPPAPQDRPDPVTPGPYHGATEPRENGWYPGGVPVPYDPAFVEGMSTEYETPTTRGQVGVAGWASQNIPLGPAALQNREQHGWLMFGVAFTWGAPPRPPATARPTPAGVPTR
jgi:hypothetical protein